MEEGHGHVKMEAEFGVMWPPAKDTKKHQKLEEAKKDPFWSLWRNIALPTPWFQTSGNQNHERIYISVVFNHQVGGNLLL